MPAVTGRAGPQRPCVWPPRRLALGPGPQAAVRGGRPPGERREAPRSPAHGGYWRPRTCCERGRPVPGPATLPLLTAARGHPGAQEPGRTAPLPAPTPTPTAGSTSPAGRRYPPLLPEASAMSPPRRTRLLRPADPRPRAGNTSHQNYS
ncbi:actin nucleation-promoting factor WASL-like [Phalacrocorax carbo]|uniref:actin nucleation-promoting factor WASL-like n=1 Tax=Phalacrocorax carbo TaxID=9209 RepID=UPI00311993E1